MGEFQGVSEKVRGEWGASLFFVVCISMYSMYIHVHVYVVYGSWEAYFFYFVFDFISF